MHDWSKIIAASVVPIVIISACGLLCLAFYNRLAAIVGRLRTFQRERLKEQEALAKLHASGQVNSAASARHQQMMEIIGAQSAEVMARARLIQRTLQCLLGTIACLTLCSACLGLSVVWPKAQDVAVPMFLIGLGLLFTGVMFAMRELSVALAPVEAEVQSVADLVSELENQVAASA